MFFVVTPSSRRVGFGRPADRCLDSPSEIRIWSVTDWSFIRVEADFGAPSTTGPTVYSFLHNDCFLTRKPKLGRIPSSPLGSSALMPALKQLAAIDQYLNGNPSVDPNNHDFLGLKKKLAASLATVVRRATADFGGPWGFVTMAELRNYSSRKWLIVNNHITKELQ